MRISKYWFRTRKYKYITKTLITIDSPKKGWSTRCRCDKCKVLFNRTFESTRFNFDLCDKCAISNLNKVMHSDNAVRKKISKKTSEWYSDANNRKLVSKIASDRYRNTEYADKHKTACQKRSAIPEYRQKLSDCAARGRLHAIKTSCGLRGISIEAFNGFLCDDNKIERAKFKEVSKQCLKKANFTCDICGKTKTRLNAHHLDGWNWCVEKRFDLSNLICLCHGCHSQFHKRYGSGNNTLQQYQEFKSLKAKI